MKRFFLISAFIIPAVAQAQDITLVCKGWAPFYEKFTSAPVNPSSENDDFIIDLDLKKRLAKFSTQVGKVVVPLKEGDRAYLGSVDVRIEAGGKYVSSVGFLANRMTGKTNINYHMSDSSDMRVLFTGKCEQGKPLF